MSWTVYRSSDASAPVLAGNTLGGLITVLDACLVNGYGSKAAAGWSNAFTTAGNVAVYRPGVASTARMYYRINDNGAFGGGGTEAAIVGYETMSDLNTGTNAFPTAAQRANGRQLGKTDAADTTSRDWFVAADAKTCIYGVYLPSILVWQVHYFGEIATFTPGDAYHAIVVAGELGSTPTGSATSPISFDFITKTNVTNGDWTANGVKYLARSHDQLGTAVASQLTPDSSICLNYAGRGATPGYQPGWGYLGKLNPADGAVYLCSFMIGYPGGVVRGKLRGMWVAMHDTRFWANNESFNGTGTLVGRTFEMKHIYPTGTANRCLMALETSNTVT